MSKLTDIVISCPDEDCCGTLTETIMSRPQCNECGKYYRLEALTQEEADKMLEVIYRNKGR
jgi:hypothetical protein